MFKKTSRGKCSQVKKPTSRTWPKEIHYLRHAPPTPRLHVEQGQKGQNAKALPPESSGEQGQKGQNSAGDYANAAGLTV
jgi:hypothetical protein